MPSSGGIPPAGGDSLDLATQLIEDDRAQLGNELHDDVMPILFAASASVSSLIDRPDMPPQQRHDRLVQIGQWLSDAMDASRRLLTQTYPPQFNGTQWTRAAKDAVERLEIDSNADLQWHLSREADQTSLPVAFAAYRIVIEAIRNAVAHGKATSIEISADQSGGEFQLIVVDNGGGFDPANVPNDRFGIRSMNRRAKLVGGILQTDSSIGGPTKITFRCQASTQK